MTTSLVIMAAGIGSRFGPGIKQLTPVGPNGELIIDYSVYDAMEAGFDKIVFVIREDIEADFRKMISDRHYANTKIKIVYAYQDLNNIPSGYSVPEGRRRPWGTGQAILTCKELINEPFAIINADDYYGKKAFSILHDYLVTHHDDRCHYAMVGFLLGNTLSEHGSVTRGLCQVDANHHLVAVKETSDIIKTQTGAEVNGVPVDINVHVSMNMWGVTPDFFEMLESEFEVFFAGLDDQNELKAEFLLPIVMDKLIKSGQVSVRMLETPDRWFGVTYAEDRPVVERALKELVERGIYSLPLIANE